MKFVNGKLFLFQKRRQIFHRREKSMLTIWAVFENSTDELLSDDKTESIAAEAKLQQIIATSDLSSSEKRKLREAIAYGIIYANFQDLAAEYLAKYTNY